MTTWCRPALPARPPAAPAVRASPGWTPAPMQNPGKDCDVSLRPLRPAPRPSACWPPSDRARGAARVSPAGTRPRSSYSQGLALWLTLNLPPLPTPGPSQRAPGLQLSPRLPPFGAPPPPLSLTSGSARLPRSPRPTEGPPHPPPAGGLCASLPRATLPRLGASQRGAPGALQPEATLARHQVTSLCAGVQGLARPRPRCAPIRALTRAFRLLAAPRSLLVWGRGPPSCGRNQKF